MRYQKGLNSTGPQYQRGVSMLKIIIVSGALGSITMFALKIVPAYIDFFSTTSLIEKYLDTSSVTLKSVDEVERTLLKRFDMNGLRSIRRNDIEISKNKGELVVDLDYFVDREVYSNDYSKLGVSIHFKKSISSN